MNASLVEFKPAEGVAALACPARYVAGAKARVAEIAAVFEKEMGRAFAIWIVEPEGGAAETAPAVQQAVAPAASGGGEQHAAPAAPVPSPAGEARGAFNPNDDPLVKQALELFNARIVSIQPR